jgi:hypothetical protein
MHDFIFECRGCGVRTTLFKEIPHSSRTIIPLNSHAFILCPGCFNQDWQLIIQPSDTTQIVEQDKIRGIVVQEGNIL